MRRFFWLSDKQLDKLISALSADGECAKLLRWAEAERDSR